MRFQWFRTTVPARSVPRAHCDCRGAASARGFTLVELMVTLAVAAILLVIAVPSFRSITISNRLDTAANDLVASMNTARMEAVKANNSALFCSNSAALNTGTLGAACNAQVGTVVLTTVSSASSTTVVRSGPNLTEGGIQLKGNVVALRYGGDGLARIPGSSAPASTGTVADICSSAMTSNNHRVISIVSGSIVATDKQSGACP